MPLGLTQVSICVFNAREAVAREECALTARTNGRLWLSSVKNLNQEKQDAALPV